MTLVREELARFIQGEGHRVELGLLGEDDGATELLFRTRGYVVSVAVREGDPPRFTIATAYEIPPWARERAQNSMTLQDVAGDVGGVRFSLAPNGKNFAVTIEREEMLEAFVRGFWPSVASVREAGIAALERILDRSESRAAANKFIRSLQKGE
ncbi:MAG TPA: hypothetical protein VIN40_08825 [Candidatus Tyrphobacter sp.]